MDVRRATKRPIEVEAVQLTEDNLADVAAWANAQVLEPDPIGDRCYLAITTLEGVMWANPGDWVIRGVAGEFYPCKADIFAVSYDVTP